MGDDHLGFRGVVFAGGAVVTLTAFTATFAALATAFTAAFAAFATTIATGCTFVAHFSAVGVQLGRSIAASFASAFIAVLATTIAAAFTGRAITGRAI